MQSSNQTDDNPFPRLTKDQIPTEEEELKNQKKRKFLNLFIQGFGTLKQIADEVGIPVTTAYSWKRELEDNWDAELLKSPSLQARIDKWYGRAVSEITQLIELAYAELNSLPQVATSDSGVDSDIEGKRITLLRTIADFYRQRNEIIGLTGKNMTEEEIKKTIRNIKEKSLKALELQKDKGLITVQEYEKKRKMIEDA